jgi:MerR family transcriptional regulator, light-induced transcriptional regulator
MNHQEPLLSPRVLAEAIGVSESSLKRWADEGRVAVERTAGGHRRIRRTEAVRFLREAGLQPVRPDLLALPGDAGGAVRGGVDRAAVPGLVVAALREDRADEARSLLVGAYLDGASFPWLCDEVIRPAMEALGTLWECGPAGILIEHRATETCGRVIAELRLLLPAAAPEAPVAVGGGFGGDIYRLPSAMAAGVLAEAGYRVHDLGPDTPVEAMLAAIERYRPALVWQSLSVLPAERARVREALGRFAAAMEGGTVVVGGRASDAVKLPRLPGVIRFRTMGELAAYTKGRTANVE